MAGADGSPSRSRRVTTASLLGTWSLIMASSLLPYPAGSSHAMTGISGSWNRGEECRQIRIGQFSNKPTTLWRHMNWQRRDPTTPPVVLASRFLEAQRKKDDALHFVDPWITAAGFTKYRRLMRWLFDGQNRVKAAEMARDPDLAAQIRVELEGARSRCRPTRSDEAWPPEWNDWPDYPPEEPGRP